MVVGIENVSAEVVNEAGDPGHNPPAVLAVNQEHDGFFLMGHLEGLPFRRK
jgi:hypothetical protein